MYMYTKNHIYQFEHVEENISYKGVHTLTYLLKYNLIDNSKHIFSRIPLYVIIYKNDKIIEIKI